MQKNKYPNLDNLDGIKLSTIFSGIKEPFQNKDDLKRAYFYVCDEIMNDLTNEALLLTQK